MEAVRRGGLRVLALSRKDLVGAPPARAAKRLGDCHPDKREARMSGTKLVMGASGFLGSHVTRQLVARGDRVRIWVRESSSTVAFDDLDVERRHGDLTD